MLFKNKGMTVNIVKTNGFFALYNGISAAVLRQATYSTTRFACYEIMKSAAETSARKKSSNPNAKIDIPFYQKILIAGLSGGLGGIFLQRVFLLCDNTNQSLI